VNVFAVGGQEPLMVFSLFFFSHIFVGLNSFSDLQSLVGHTSAVSSVSFDASEEFIAAGSVRGIVKVWDLEQAKGFPLLVFFNSQQTTLAQSYSVGGPVVRTLNEHRAECSAVEFHPFGELLGSGCGDSSIKVWDLRQKSCIQTYHGHEGPIKILKFSPDGKWVVSGSEDGLIKVFEHFELHNCQPNKQNKQRKTHKETCSNADLGSDSWQDCWVHCWSQGRNLCP